MHLDFSRKNKTVVASLGVGILIFVAGGRTGLAAERGCGHATVENSVPKCAAVKVKFHLLDCHDTVQIDEPVVTCYSSKSATARVRTGDYIYQVDLAPAKSGKRWVIDGPVQRIKRKSPEEAPLETPPPAPKAPQKEAPAPAKQDWSISGLLDAYYGYDFNGVTRSALPSPAAPGPAPANISLHEYDFYSNQFTLNLAELTLERETEKVGFLLDLDFGVIADAEAITETGVVDAISKNVGQAIVSWTPTPAFAIRVGKMATHLGYESAKAIEDFQYSRSFLFTLGIPHWHLGMALDFGILPKVLTLSAYLYNGWDELYDNNDGKTVGARLAWTPNEHFSLTYNGIVGPEQANNNSDLTQVHEGILAWSPSKAVSFALDFIYGNSANQLVGATVMNTSWLAGFLDNRVWLGDSYFFSYRLGFFDDPQGFRTGTGVGQTLFEGTITNGIKVADGLETRLEFRYDASTATPFATSAGNSSTQPTGTVSFLYKF